jgi:putative transposase
MEWFDSLKEAQVVIELWREHYNHERPHSALVYLSQH